MKRAIFAIGLCFLGFSLSGQGIDVTKLNSVITISDKMISNDTNAYFRNVDSWIIYYDGEVKFEKYYHGFTKDSLHHIQSQTKSFTSLLAGIAIDQGLIKNENEPVARWFPDYFNNSDSLKFQVTLRDLLTMSGGFQWEEMLVPFTDPTNDNGNMYRSGHWLQYALTRQMAHKPFTVFKYNSGSPMIVAGIIEKASNMQLDKFAEKYFFNQLDIKDYRWSKDSTGLCHAGGGLYLKPSDIIKAGVMVLDKGMYNGKRVISESWLSKSFSPYFKTEFGGKEYGYFWWIKEMKINNTKSTRVISAEGAGGQSLFIIPEYGMVIGFTERNYTTPQVGPWIVREYLLPTLN